MLLLVRDLLCILSLNSGVAITAKSLMLVWKKLHNPTKDRIILTSAGAMAVWIALSLFLPGLMPSGVRVKPRYETSLLLKKHLSKLIFRLCELVLALLDVPHESLCAQVGHQCRQSH